MARPIQPLVNFRDVGESINEFAGKELLTTGILYRSARPDYSNLDSLKLLRNAGIKTLLDLRTDTERLEQPPKNNAISSLGLDTRIVDFNGRAYTRALMKQLSFWQSAQLISYYAVGYRKDAISVLSKNVLSRRGLVGLAEDSLTCSTAEVKAVFDMLAESDSLPILVHCTQGKDRTGLIILLVLMLLQVPVQAIQEDYLASQKELLPEREARLVEIRSIGLPDSFADCEQQWATTVAAWIDHKYGGVIPYLKSCGIEEDVQKRIVTRLQAN